MSNKNETEITSEGQTAYDEFSQPVQCKIFVLLIGS